MPDIQVISDSDQLVQVFAEHANAYMRVFDSPTPWGSWYAAAVIAPDLLIQLDDGFTGDLPVTHQAAWSNRLHECGVEYRLLRYDGAERVAQFTLSNSPLGA